MYQRFIGGNSIKSNLSSVKGNVSRSINSELDTLFAECGGASINNGLYRVHTYSSGIAWSEALQQYFSGIGKTILSFGYDWIGRQYAIVHGIDNILLMFDPATFESFQIAGSVVDFHNRDLTEDRDATVSENSFKTVLVNLKISELTFQQCIGYKVPLFLGGQDNYDNYEVVDMEVYWDIQYQMYEQVKNLPPGTKISSVKFKSGN